MVTFAQAQERAEEWINGDVPSYQHREVRVREFDLGFVVWAEDRADGPRSDGGAQRLVIARDSGEATLWPSLPVGEVIRRYEEEYGREGGVEDVGAGGAAASRVDLNQTSFLLTPPEWLQDAADKLGIGDRRGEDEAAQDGAGATAEGDGGPEVPAGARPWTGTDTNGGEDLSVALPETVFSPPPPPSPEADRASYGYPQGPGGSDAGVSPSGPGASSYGYPQAEGGQRASSYGYPQAEGGQRASSYGYPQGPGGDPGAARPPGVPGAPGPAPSAEDIADVATSKLAPPSRGAQGGGSAPPPPPSAPGVQPGSPPPPPAPGGGYVPTQFVSAPGVEGPSGAPQPPGAPPVYGGAPTPPPPGAAGGHGTPGTPGATGTPGMPNPPGAPGFPNAPGAGAVPGVGQPPGGPGPGAPQGTGAPGYPGAPSASGGAPQPPGAPGVPGAASGAVHHAETVLSTPPVGGPGVPPPPQPPGVPGASGALGGPGASGTPGGSGGPGGPGGPGVPPPPQPPGVPGASGAPGGPGASGTPDGSGGPGGLSGPGGPGVPPPPQPPGVPGAPSGPGAGVPGGPGVPGASGVPGAPAAAPGAPQSMPPGTMPPPPPPPGAVPSPGPVPPPGHAMPAPPAPGQPAPSQPSAYGFPHQSQPTVGPGYQAVLRYRAQDGSEQQLIRRSAPGTPHPEWQIFHELRGMNVPPDQVLELHTELESCELPGAYCARMIREQWPQARIASIAPYGTDHASRQQGMQQLLAHQGELHQVADGPARPAPARTPLPPVQAAPPIPPEGVAQELAGAFGPGVFRFEQAAVSRQGVPPVVAHSLVVAGLPLDMGPFFWAQAQQGRPVPTLAELAAERGVQPAADAGSYLVMGSDFGKALCVQYGTANIVAVPVEAGPGGTPVPPQFVNTGLPEFQRCLALLGRMWRLRFGLNQEQAGRWTVDFQAQLASLDPAALGSPESWWSVLLEQMWDGLL
ncbi:SUKH-4 family immunity protein [Streptomyces sp. NPDC048420]|uniref:SUKH-4 family immunity protein n=1 Tax=Streptomyces sp. NPDC048420 TaxID=3155755 RepID=UPI0034273CB6